MWTRTLFTTTLALATAAALAAPAPAGCDHTVVLNGGSIQTAINISDPGDVICLQAGIYQQTNIVIDKPLTIRGVGMQGSPGGGTTISGFGVSARVIQITSAGSGTVIENLEIRDGGPVSTGGGIHIENASEVELRDVAFTTNSATTGGGGVYCQNTTLIVADCVFQGNYGGTAGGGLWGNDGTVAVISGSDFVSNATNNSGGGARFDNAVATLSDCLFDGNDTGNTNETGGGGIFLWHADLTVDNSIFRNNEAARGAAVRSTFDDDSFTLRNCLIQSNVHATVSGALHNNGSCFIGSCTVYGNTRGLFIEAGGAPLTTIRNSIFWNNGSPEITLSGAVVRNSIIAGGYAAGPGSSNVLSFSPGFVSQPSNLRLASSSNAIDNGSSSSYAGQAVDLDGNVRATDDPNHEDTAYGETTLGPIVDIGAYEFQPPAPPFNDACANALPIADGDTAYSTVGALTDGTDQPGCAGDAGANADVWFRYTPATSGTLAMSTCNQADYDTTLQAYTGACGGLSLIGCNDDSGGCSGFTSYLEVPVTAGQAILVRVGGYNGDSGTGTLTLTPPAPCPADTNGDGLVNVDDLVNVVLGWGACPF